VLVFSLASLQALAQTNGPIQPPSELKKMSLDELFQMEVTSVSKEPEKLSASASAIQVITGDEIRRSGAMNIPEALRLADNLNVAQKNSSDYAISARGFNGSVSDKLLVMIDGRTVYDPLFSGVIWNMQDTLLEDIDRIEVISGPGGSVWGANAVNGVINITSKSSQDTQGTYVEAGGGTLWQDFTAVRYGGTLASNVYYRVYGKYFDHDSLVISNGTDAGDAWRRGQGGFRIDAVQSADNTFTLQGDGYGGDINVPTGDNATVNGGNVLGRWKHTFSDVSDMTLQAYYDRTDLVDPFPASGTIPSGFLRDSLDTYDVDFQHHFELGERNDIVWGLGYRFTHDVVGNAPTVAFLPPVLDHSLYSGFVQDKIRLLRNVYFTLGTKIEHNDYTGFEFEPSGRLQWNITDKQMVWGAVSRAIRMPARYDRNLFEPNPSVALFLEGNPDFQSETLIAYEVGYRAQLFRTISTSVSGYYNSYDRLRSLGFANGTAPPVEFQNNNEGNTYGFEYSATYQPVDWWRVRGGYDLLKEDIHVKPGDVDLFGSLAETADPQQQFSVRPSLDLMKNLELDSALRWVDTLHNNNGATPGTVPSYFELDARLAWRLNKRIELSVVGQSLLHDQHPEYGFPGPTREQIPRSVYGKVTCWF
jgi:iron complex outermembrane receptor protein